MSAGPTGVHVPPCRRQRARRRPVSDVEESFGWEYESHQESADRVEVALRGPDGQRKVVRAKRLIKAFGHHVTPNEPLAVTSSQVRSITPELIGAHDAELRADDTPNWIVGGGKTAMDAAHLLITTFPGCEVNMLAGPGTIFTRRDTFFPVGAKRWWSGTPINTMVRQTTRRFDGTNEDEVRDWFRATYGIGPVDGARDYFGAYMSDAECALAIWKPWKRPSPAPRRSTAAVRMSTSKASSWPGLRRMRWTIGSYLPIVHGVSPSSATPSGGAARIVAVAAA